jgi:alcohol dehydrogenase class IV
MAANQKALALRPPDINAMERYWEVAVILTGRPVAKPEHGVAYCENLRKELKIPRLNELGVKKEDFGVICEKASKASSMKGNPVELTQEELHDIMDKAF